MNPNNYLNIPTSEQNKFIYRIISVSRLYELFNDQKNVLVKPHKWVDPFENFILHSEQIYGQCWTFQSASDAMWRIYSPESGSVRIRSTVQKLTNSLSQTRDNLAQAEVFIGRVQYLPSKKLIAYAKSILLGSTMFTARMLAQSLLVKRPAFEHEREVRLLFIPYDKTQASTDIFYYSIAPHTLIDQIMIDPRVSKEKAESLKQEIKEKTKFYGKIMRSLLYQLPPEFLEEIQKLQNKF